MCVCVRYVSAYDLGIIVHQPKIGVDSFLIGGYFTRGSLQTPNGREVRILIRYLH
jgi:hypothetical protein